MTTVYSSIVTVFSLPFWSLKYRVAQKNVPNFS